MNKTAIHNIAIAILTLPVFILSVFKPIVKVFSKLSKIFYSQWKRTEFKTCPRNVIIEYKIEVGGGNNISNRVPRSCLQPIHSTIEGKLSYARPISFLIRFLRPLSDALRTIPE